MPHVAWLLNDYSTGSLVQFAFPINPNEFTPPGRQANVANEVSAAPNGQSIVFQGRDQIPTGQMSGLVNAQAFYTDLDTWCDKGYVLELVDDQTSTWNILITQIDWKRIRRANNNWRYDYTIDFLEVA